MVEWISVEERLPVERGDYLCVLTDNREALFQLVLTHYGATEHGYTPKNWWSGSSTVEYTNVTHWRPLPSMPDECRSERTYLCSQPAEAGLKSSQ